MGPCWTIDPRGVTRHLTPTARQVECHPYWAQNKLRSFLHAHGIALVAYSPLGNLDPNDASKPSPLRDPLIAELAAKWVVHPCSLQYLCQSSRTTTALSISCPPVFVSPGTGSRRRRS
jgi:diketogulonate reductase-like aldo/keto reductase